MDHTVDTWEKCYPSNWKGLIVPEAMSHPAKFSSRLIRRIYDHMVEEGWLRIGDSVVDPFGGVAMGALEAMRHGLNWTGIELELKFVELGGKNIELWDKKFHSMPHWGSAQLCQGDSRKLLEVVGRVRAAMKSPPYNDARIAEPGNYMDSMRRSKEERYGGTPGQLGGMKSDGFDAAISSPPFLQSEGGTPEPKPGGSIDEALYARHAAGNAAANGYGESEGQLSSMKDGGFEGAISSPPYADGSRHTGGDDHHPEKMQGGTYHGVGIHGSVSSPPYNPPMSQDHNGSRGGKRGTTPSEPGAFVKYGNTEGQLEGMDMDGFEGAVSSPPFEDSRSRDFIDAEARREVARANGISNAEHVSPIDAGRLKAPDDIYGATAGQLGNDSGETFWSAARTIVEQVYQALVPGGHAVWVVKDYVKNKKVVPFCDQWRQLCEAVGFVTLHEHRAMLVHHKGTSHTLEGGTVEHKTESKSFFRRLAESKGSPRIDYEVVFCMVKE